MPRKGEPRPKAAAPPRERLSALSTGLALEVAGRRFRRVLTDAEIDGVWSLAWLPETSGNVTHQGFKLAGNPEDPIDRLDPFNLPMAAFLDAFARQPETVIDLLARFRRYIREEVGKPGTSLVHAAFIAAGTAKEAANVLAEAESKGAPTLAAVASAGRRLRRHRAAVEPSSANQLWPTVAATGAEPVRRKQRRGADKKAG